MLGPEAVLPLPQPSTVLMEKGPTEMSLVLREGPLRRSRPLGEAPLRALVRALLSSDLLVELRDRLCQASLARFQGLALGGLFLLHLETPLLAPLQLTPPEGQLPIALGHALAVLHRSGLHGLVGRE